MLSQGYSFQIDRPTDVEAKSIEGPVDSAFQSTGGKETFAVLERLLVPLGVEAAKSAAKGAAEKEENKEVDQEVDQEEEEEKAYRLLCLLRLLDDNFVAYQRRERLNNGEEKTVTIRVASSASSSSSSSASSPVSSFVLLGEIFDFFLSDLFIILCIFHNN